MRALVAVAATSVMIPALVACGSSDDKVGTAPTDTSSSVATADPAATKTGLTNMVSLANRIAAADGPTGKKLAEGLEGFWAPIEDGIKAKDADTYTSIEDAMAGLESGDQGDATKAAADLEGAVSAYLAK